MYRVLKSNKDAYITNKVIRGSQVFTANTGKAGSIDIFKLHNISLVNSTYVDELSRGLVNFDLSQLQSDYIAGKFDIASPSFNARLQLIDVYGGQPTPSNFTMIVYPLSKSFDEGLGRDVVYYSDSDVVNFYTSSYNNGNPILWNSIGANAKGLLGSSDIDIIASGNLGSGIINLWSTQSFTLGTENLDVDITTAISSALSNNIPSYGFRVSYTENEEVDNFSYFVKRFGSSQASDPYVHPRLIIKYNDSITDHQSNFTFDNTETIFLSNFIRGNKSNLLSGSAQITGSNCLLLRIETPIYNSTSSYIAYITASQHSIGTKNVVGLYSASFSLDSTNSVYKTQLQNTGSVSFSQIWTSLDGTIPYFSGSFIAYPQLGTNDTTPRKLSVSINNVFTEYKQSDITRFKLFIFDNNNPTVKLTKLPIDTPSIFLDSIYYSVRDVITNDVIIPFDTIYNSTKVSNDAKYLYFDIYMSNLFIGRSYAIDILIVDAGQQTIYKNASPAFRVIQ
jgi:hypothetical protein